jgi:hypothetical protein
MENMMDGSNKVDERDNFPSEMNPYLSIISQASR